MPLLSFPGFVVVSGKMEAVLPWHADFWGGADYEAAKQTKKIQGLPETPGTVPNLAFLMPEVRSPCWYKPLPS